MASVVVFCTVYALILPAITMSAQDAKCGFEEHTHTAECYDAEGNVICGLEEHVHTIACYSDLYADIENADVWNATVPGLSGERNADVVGVAASQLGYRESDKNYLVFGGDQTQGYTRYGHWYGDAVDGSAERLANGLSAYAYQNWDAMFVSFVLDHAGIYDMGLDCDAGNWAGALAAAGKYVDAADYIPEAGDLIFYTPYAGAGVKVGIVTDVNKGFLGLFGDDVKSISVITGDSDNAVSEIRVAVGEYNEGDVAFETIHGYGVLTPRAEEPADVSVADEVVDGSEVQVEVPAEDPDGAPADEATAEAEVALDAETVPAEGAVVEETPADVSTAAVVPTEEIVPEVAAPATPADASVAEQTVDAVPGEAADVQEEVVAEQPTEEVSAEQPVETTEDATVEAGNKTEIIENLSDDTEHIIGASSEDLEKAEEVGTADVYVTALQAGLNDEGSAIVMNWQVEAQLKEGVLPAGAIIRVDTATGKTHGMTAAEAKAWAGSAVIGGEAATFVDNENYEVTFIGSNDLLYTWADVQAMGDGAVTTFTGVHVKVLADVAVSENGGVELAFETTARIADANVGQNYYVTKVSVDGQVGFATYTYKNGEAVPVDQDKVLQDAGLTESETDASRTYTLVAKGPGYTVTMSYGEDAGIPEVAKLKVSEIKEGTEEYDNYIAEARAAIGLSKDDTAEVHGRFFDIKIMTKDGEYEPKAAVSVNINYSDAISDIDSENVSAVHFADDGAEKVDVEASVVDGNIEGVDFEAESFSVYGILYTVDFEYDGYMYSLDGGEQVLLSELLSSLRIDVETSEITDVTFTDETLLTVEKIDGDWMLHSVQSFETEETLTITLTDGVVYKITVTDPPAKSTRDLNSLVTGASIAIDGVSYDEDDTWSVMEAEEYTVTLSFAESRRNQFANDTSSSPLVYDVPEGFSISEDCTGGTFTIDLGTDGKVEGNTWVYDSSTNQIYVYWNMDSDNFDSFKAAGNAEFSISITGTFETSQNEIEFGDDVTVTIEEDTTQNVSIVKSGYYSDDDQKIHYTLTVTSEGATENIVVTDDIYGTALTYGYDMTLSSSTGNSVSYSSVYANDDGFQINIPSMSNGEVITINYTANVDFSEIATSGYATLTETGNSVKVTPEEDDNPDDDTSTNYESQISYSDFSKVATSVSDAYEIDGKYYRTVSWKITTNEHQVISIADSTITDKIVSPDNMVYSGDGLTITVTDEDGSTSVREVSWSDLTVHEDQTWTYTVPSTDGKYKYVIEYTTVVDITDLTSSVTAKNTGSGKGGSADAATTIGPPAEPDEIAVTKSATDVTTDEVTWTITVNVDKEGYSSFVVTDYLPTIYGNNIGLDEQWYYDTYVDGSLSVEGLLEGECYDDPPTTEVTSYQISGGTLTGQVLTIKFYQNSGKTQEGLLSSDENRTLTITFKTKCNEDWIEATEDATDYTTVHTNTVKVTTPDATGEAEADAVPVESSVDKSLGTGYNGDAEGTTTIDGVELPYYRYDVVIANVKSDDLYIQDSFNDEILRVWSENTDYRNLKVYGGDAGSQWGTGSNGETYIADVEYVPISGNHYLYIEEFPKQDDGTFFSHYRISYYLIVKDEEALEKLKQLAVANGGTASLTNTATWETEGDSETVTYQYKGLDKECLGYDESTRTASFQITINPDGYKLNGGEPMTLTDTYTNLSVDYSTIAVTCDPEENADQVSWDYSGDTGTFTIPDSTKVIITYSAVVKGTTGTDVTFSNTATCLGYSDTVTENVTLSVDAGGSASVFNIRLFKYEYKNMTVGLEGAVFQLYEAVYDDDGNETGMNPLTFQVAGTSTTACSDEDGTDHTHEEGDYIYFATGEDGYVSIELSADTDGEWLEMNKKYYLIEVKAPENYNLSTTQWNFEISTDASYDTEKNAYRYYDNDILKVADTKPGKIVLEKTFTDNSMLYEDNLTEQQKEDILFYVYDGDTIETDGDGNVTNLVAVISYADFTDGTYTLVSTENYDIVRDYTYLIVEVSNVSCESLTTTYTVNGTALDASSSGATVDASDETDADSEANTVTVSNEYEIETTDVSATKAWLNNDGTVTAPENGYVIFTLYADGDATTQTVTLDGTVDEDGELTAWVATFPELPKYKSVDGEDVEIAYTVVETQGWTDYTADTTSVSNGGTITNEEDDKGALRLTKAVTVNGASTSDDLADGTYTFTVTGPGSDGTFSKIVKITITDGTVASAQMGDSEDSLADTTLDSEGYVVISDLDAGDYTITETTPTNGTEISLINGAESTSYSTTVTVTDGDTTGANASAAFTNNIDTGNLSLTKTVSGTTDTETEFEFTITLTAPTGVELADSYPATITEGESETATTVSVSSGVVTQSLKAGQTLTITDLPAGTTYVITEEDYSSLGYVQGTTSNLGTADAPIEIPAQDTISASVENKFQAEDTTSFTVKKTFTNGDLSQNTFTFRLIQVEGNESTTQVTTKLGSAVEISTDSSVGGTEQTLSFNLPETFVFTQDDIGSTYWFLIEELVADGVTLDDDSIDQTNNIQYATVRQQWVSVTITKSGSSLVITKSTGTDATADAEFTNEQLGEIKVKKVAQKGGNTDTDNTEVFYFGLSSDADTFTRVDGTENVAVTANADEIVAWTNLELGTYYVFEMQGNSGDEADTPVGEQFGEYTVTDSGTDVTLSASETSLTKTITNNKELVDINAAKVWKNSSGDEITDTIANASVTFTLQQSTDNGTTWATVEDLTEEDNTNLATVTLKVEGTASADAWAVSWTNLAKYADEEVIQYRVVEEIVTPLDASAENNTTEVVASFSESQDGNDTAEVSLTNVLPTTELSGSKTWVDTQSTHTSPVLTLTRTSAKEGATAETVTDADGENLQPTWNSTDYTYTDLPKYDDEGYEYTYEVAEASFTVNEVTYTAVKADDGTYTVTAGDSSASEYVTTQEGYNFTNTELTNFEFTKVWTTSGSTELDAWHDGQTITVTLSRKLIPDDGSDSEYTEDVETYVLNQDGLVSGGGTYTIQVEVSGTEYTFVISDLPAAGSITSGDTEIEGTWEYYISEQIDENFYDVYYFEAGKDQENLEDEFVKDGGTIQNDLRSYSLPITGGIGTKPLRTAGIVMVVMALFGVFLMRKREGRFNG